VPAFADLCRTQPLAVNFAWLPDYPENDERARATFTAVCGCRWRTTSEAERDAWVAALDHAGRLAEWHDRPLLARPRLDVGRKDGRTQHWQHEMDRLPGVPMRSLMACDDEASGRRVHACRGVIPPDAFGGGELCACPCHELSPREPDSCQYCDVLIGHRGDCPTWKRDTPAPPEPQLSLF
jgi:hypothetical protein